MECKSRKKEIEKQLNILLKKDRRSKRRQEIVRKASSSGRRSTTPVFSSSCLSSDSVCSEASTPTSRSSSVKSSDDVDKQLEYRGKKRLLELVLTGDSSRKDQQEAVTQRTLSLSPPDRHQIHSLSSDEDAQSASIINPTGSIVEYLADEEEAEHCF